VYENALAPWVRLGTIRRTDLPYTGFILDNLKERILVVDDDPTVLALVATILHRAGYDVITSSDPAEAVKASDNSTPPIDLLLTDVTMPVLSGPSLAELICRNAPGTRVLYMTGKPMIDSAVPDGADVLRKPFRPRVLVERVVRALTKVASAAAC
jgi:DNA-binding response OmpR family regulator